jgi:peptidoglycan/LPS O-acetylase OafA/YrhL
VLRATFDEFDELHGAFRSLCVTVRPDTLAMCLVAPGRAHGKTKLLRVCSGRHHHHGQTTEACALVRSICMPPSAAPSILVLWNPAVSPRPSSLLAQEITDAHACSAVIDPRIKVASCRAWRRRRLPRPGEAAGVAALVAVACALSYVTIEALVCPDTVSYRWGGRLAPSGGDGPSLCTRAVSGRVRPPLLGRAQPREIMRVVGP